ncbi:MAG: hypothetical protein N2689_18320 [Verrucomicrobiae bacterium]|nr:hypothetical protein [Verrucomicrobiae bacterium]
MSVTRPVVVLLVVGAVLCGFALGTKRPGGPSGKALKDKTSDARATLQEFVTLVNQRDAIGLAAILHRPFYAEKKKFENDEERQELIGKLLTEVRLPLALGSVKVCTATEAGLPPEADQLLTADDTIFLVELQSGDNSSQHAVVVRKTPEGCQLVAAIKSPAP